MLLPPAQKPSPSFRTGVEVVSLNVTVLNGENRFVTDLEQDEFLVFEDGAKQDVTFFTRSQLPIALSILLDTSASMEDKMTTAQEAAVGFAKRLRPEDQAQVIDFDSRVSILQQFTNDAAALTKAIRSTAAGGSTSMFNAIYIALNEMKKVRAQSTEEIRRRAIVVLSDGEDTSSLLPFEEVMELAKRSETAIYTIGIRSREPGTMRGFREAEFVLKQLAYETGGRSFFPGGVHELAGHLHTDRRRVVQPVHPGLHLQEPETRRQLAPGRGAARAPQHDGADQAGVLRADAVRESAAGFAARARRLSAYRLSAIGCRGCQPGIPLRWVSRAEVGPGRVSHS